MKIILISAVPNLGNIGDVVEVKNGYAKNFLIPNNIAICYTPNNYKVFEAKKDQFEKANQDSLGLANKVKEQIEGKDIIIIENASDDGRLYGSVNSSVIAAKINDIVKEKIVLKSHIFLAKPIKEIGIYNVVLKPHSEINFSARLIVSRNESEVKALLDSEKKEKSKKVSKEEGEKEEINN